MALTATIVAVALFAMPLAFAVRQLYFTNEQDELERAALRAVSAVGPEVQGGDPIELPKSESDVSVAVYGHDGTLLAGVGPTVADAGVRHALTGQLSQGQENGWLIAVVPVSSSESVIGVVRAATPVVNVWRRTLLTWAAMLGLALLAVSIAVAVARRQARRLSSPLESVARTAHVLGDGDFTVRSVRSGVWEIDETGAALDATAIRLGQLVAREREFSANASHQLRTPLTGLRLGLEAALGQSHEALEAAAAQAITTADELERTISELLSLTHGSEGDAQTTVTAAELVLEVEGRWRGPLAAEGRPLRVIVEPQAPSTGFSLTAVRQILDILLDNALRHGSGAVDVVARDSGTALALDVRDQGSNLEMNHQVFDRGHSGAGRSGIGLALARDLAQARGGRLILARVSPTTVFTVLLPGTQPGADR